MICEKKIIEKIEADGVFNFGDILIQGSHEISSSEQENKILNTVELFAFGGCTNYAQDPSKYLSLSEKGKKKLIALSIISVLNANIGNTIAYSALLKEVAPFVMSSEELENTIIELISTGVIDARMNEETSSLRVIETSVIRDAYNENNYTLRVLPKTELKVMPVSQARHILGKWLEEYIVPASQDFVPTPVTQ